MTTTGPISSSFPNLPGSQKIQQTQIQTANASVEGTADITAAGLYGGGGTLTGKKLDLKFGTGETYGATQTINWAGANCANEVAMLAAIDALSVAWTAEQGGAGGNKLVLTKTNALGVFQILSSSTCLAQLGLTAGVYSYSTSTNIMLQASTEQGTAVQQWVEATIGGNNVDVVGNQDNVRVSGWNAKQLIDSSLAYGCRTAERAFVSYGGTSKAFEFYTEFGHALGANIVRTDFAVYDQNSNNALVQWQTLGPQNFTWFNGATQIAAMGPSGGLYLGSNYPAGGILNTVYPGGTLLESRDDGGTGRSLIAQFANNETQWGRETQRNTVIAANGALGGVRIGVTDLINGFTFIWYGLSVKATDATHRVVGIGTDSPDMTTGGDIITHIAVAAVAPTSAPATGAVIWFDAGSGNLKIWRAGAGAAQTFVVA